MFTDAGKTTKNSTNKKAWFAAILSQKDLESGNLLTIAYASHSISATEKNWSQRELEALALRFGVDKWRHFFTGIEIL